MATSRTLSFRGYKLGLDTATITVTINGQQIYSGPVNNDTDAEIFSYIVPVTEITSAQIPQEMTNDIIPVITTEYAVVVECTAGTMRVSDVRTPRLDAFDELPLILDGDNYGFPGQPATNFDSKYDVHLNLQPITVERLEQATGGWHHTVAAGNRLSFKIRVMNHVQIS
jgi:hypothetical protein